MQKSKRIYVDHVISALGLLMLLLFAVLEILTRVDLAISLHAVTRTLLLVLVCLLIYCGTLLYTRRTNDLRRMRYAFYLFFALYLYLIFTFTLMDATLGRNGDFLYNNVKIHDRREHYIRWFVNLVPFHSIYEVYILGLIRGYVNVFYMLFNFVGNLCAFMPFAFFLPLFLKHQRKWYFFVPTVVLLSAAVEALQFAFMIGSCDVDDLILNAGGAVILYFVLKIPAVARLCNKILQNSFA